MPYRSSSKYHKIRKLKTATGTNHSITITEKTANSFDTSVFQEIVLSDGILLIKSGCEINEKIINAIG